MDNNWAINEFSQVDFGDERLNKRLITLSSKLAEAPESTINQVCGSWAETKAAYRFFQNDKITYKEITNSHMEAVKQRCEEYPTILAIQDTTYMNYTNHIGTKGLCPLSRNRGKHKKEIPTVGLVMHSTLCISTDGLPLGIIDQKIYARPELSEEVKEIKKRTHNVAFSIEEKDSFRWIEALQNTYKVFDALSSNAVTICDREGDMYDFFFTAFNLKLNVLVRANHNRKVNKNSPYSETSGIELWDLIKRTKVIGTIDIKIPKRTEQVERIAICKIQIGKLNIAAPRNLKNSRELPILQMNAIYVSEKRCPDNIEPIDWMLLTDIPIENLEQALEKIRWYCLRWRIEVFHKVLKSGLKVEDCRLSTSDRLIRYLAVMSVIAWRIFWITLVARVAPDSSCCLLLKDNEWKILYSRFNENKKLPKKPPSLEQCSIIS
jgi:hypothetical protein